MRTLILISCFLFSSNIFAQRLQILKKIGQGEPNTVTGLGQTFEGGFIDDGRMLFIASQDGFTLQLWETNGTPEGTQKIIDAPGTFFGSSWGEKFFLQEGAIIEESNNMTYFAPDGNKTVLVDTGESAWQQYVKTNSGYIFLAEGNGAEVWQTDLSAAGTNLVGIFDQNFGSFRSFSANEAFAMYSDDETEILDFTTGETQDLRDYLRPYQEYETIRYGYTHGNFIFFQDATLTEYVFNIEEETISPFTFMREPKQYLQRGDDLYILTGSEIVKMNTITMEYEELYDDVFAFTPFHINDDKLYIVGSNFSIDPTIHEIDFSTGSTTILSGSEIGEINYNCKIEHHNGEMYYTVDDGFSQYLYKYDFINSAPVFVDTIAVENGPLTITHGLEVIGDKLIVSKWTSALGHELYLLDESSSLSQITEQNVIKIYPSLAETTITLQIEPQDFQGQNIQIYNDQGQLIKSTSLTSTTVDVSNLAKGSYFGIIRSKTDTVQTFKFIKS